MGGSSSGREYILALHAPDRRIRLRPRPAPISRRTRTRSTACCATSIPSIANPATGIWALSRYADVRDAATDTATFSSENTDITVGLLPQIQSMDPPRHDALRGLVSRAFTGRRADAMEPRIRAIARRLIDGFAARGEADLMARVRAPSAEPRDRRDDRRARGPPRGVPRLDRGDGRERRGRHPAATIQAATNIYAEFSKLLAERRSARARRPDERARRRRDRRRAAQRGGAARVLLHADRRGQRHHHQPDRERRRAARGAPGAARACSRATRPRSPTRSRRCCAASRPRRRCRGA